MKLLVPIDPLKLCIKESDNRGTCPKSLLVAVRGTGVCDSVEEFFECDVSVELIERAHTISQRLYRKNPDFFDVSHPIFNVGYKDADRWETHQIYKVDQEPAKVRRFSDNDVQEWEREKLVAPLVIIALANGYVDD